MKKISALIMAAMILIIGGVYATWTFAGEQTKAVSTSTSIAITEAKVEGTRGTYSINASSNMFTVDQESATSHKAKLIVADDAKITITFTPNETAEASVIDKGIETKFQFSFETNSQYDNKDIFVLDTTEHSIEPVGGTNAWTKQTNGTFTYEIDRASLVAGLTINDFTIDTIAKYKDFKTALEKISIKLTVTDPTATEA